MRLTPFNWKSSILYYRFLHNLHLPGNIRLRKRQHSHFTFTRIRSKTQGPWVLTIGKVCKADFLKKELFIALNIKFNFERLFQLYPVSAFCKFYFRSGYEHDSELQPSRKQAGTCIQQNHNAMQIAPLAIAHVPRCVCVEVYVQVCVNLCCRTAKNPKKITNIESNIASRLVQFPFFSFIDFDFYFKV